MTFDEWFGQQAILAEHPWGRRVYRAIWIEAQRDAENELRALRETVGDLVTALEICQRWNWQSDIGEEALYERVAAALAKARAVTPAKEG